MGRRGRSDLLALACARALGNVGLIGIVTFWEKKLYLFSILSRYFRIDFGRDLTEEEAVRLMMQRER